MDGSGMQVIQVQMPHGVMPGQMFMVQTPQGPVNVQAPPDAVPGGVFMAQVPMMQQPMQQPMMQGQMMPPMMQQPMADGYALLNGMGKCEVQEKVLWGEVLGAVIGVEVNFGNKYKVFDENKNEVFLIAEQTDCCTMQMKRGCCQDCVGWNADIINIYGGQRTNFLHMQRDFTLTCCCLNRPVMDLHDVASGNKIGSLRDPFACCDLTFNMMDPEGKDVLAAKGGCCQWGLCCPLPCGPCASVSFELVDIASGDKVGEITKKVPSCCKFLIDSEVDNYQVDFNAVTNPQWKALVMALTVFIDFRYFSENQDPAEVGETGILGAVTD